MVSIGHSSLVYSDLQLAITCIGDQVESKLQQAPTQLWWHQIAQSSQILFLYSLWLQAIPNTYDTNVANGWLVGWLCEFLF
jgi:hypothetical protein